MKNCFIAFFILFVSATYGQQQVALSPEGVKLQKFYLAMDIENNWLAGHHINWETGKPDMPEAKNGNKTHCSAFTAAACQQAGIYLLRPPQHGQILLANAQFDWLNSPDGEKNGWHKLTDTSRYLQAQQLANAGKMVIAVFKNADRHKPGHAAMIMPVERSIKAIQDEGPEVIMAGTHNHNFISLKNGFKSHITAWPEEKIELFVQDKLPF